MVLFNFTQATLSSLSDPGQDYDHNNLNCLWIITTLPHDSNQFVYENTQAPGTITFRIKDIALDCQTDHVYVYDGIPDFKINSTGSFNPIGSLCGTNPFGIPALESSSGTMVVMFRGNIGANSRTSGFNASVVVNQCPNSCTGNRYCRRNGMKESCVCKASWTGPACDDVICPENCSDSLGYGHCDLVSSCEQSVYPSTGQFVTIIFSSQRMLLS